MMTDNQRAFFNRAWSSNIGGEPAWNPGNIEPERWREHEYGTHEKPAL